MGGMISGIFGGGGDEQSATQSSTQQNNQSLAQAIMNNTQDPNAPVQAYTNQFVQSPSQNQNSLLGMYSSMNQPQQQNQNSNGGFNPWLKNNNRGLGSFFLGGN